LEKILNIIEAMAHEKNISVENAMEAFKDAVINTARRLTGEEENFEVEIDRDTQNYKIYKVVTVVPEDDPRAEDEPDKYITLDRARNYDDAIETGDQIRTEFHLED